MRRFADAGLTRSMTKTQEEAYQDLLEETAREIDGSIHDQASLGFFTYTTHPLAGRLADELQEDLMECGYAVHSELHPSSNGKTYKKLHIGWGAA